MLHLPNTASASAAQLKSAAQKGGCSLPPPKSPVDDIDFLDSLNDDCSISEILRVIR